MLLWEWRELWTGQSRVQLFGFSLTSMWLPTGGFTSHSRVLICERELTRPTRLECLRVTGHAQNGHSLASLVAPMLHLSLWPGLEGAAGGPCPSHLPEHPELAAFSASASESLALSASRAPPPRGWDSWPMARRPLCPWKKPE